MGERGENTWNFFDFPQTFWHISQLHKTNSRGTMLLPRTERLYSSFCHGLFRPLRLVSTNYAALSLVLGFAMEGGMFIKRYRLTLVLALLLVVLSVASLFIGVMDVNLTGLMSGQSQHWKIFLISRVPMLLAILCTGVGMSVAVLFMQHL